MNKISDMIKELQELTSSFEELEIELPADESGTISGDAYKEPAWEGDDAVVSEPRPSMHSQKENKRKEKDQVKMEREKKRFSAGQSKGKNRQKGPLLEVKDLDNNVEVINNVEVTESLDENYSYNLNILGKVDINSLRRSILMNEILAPPLSKRKFYK